MIENLIGGFVKILNLHSKKEYYQKKIDGYKTPKRTKLKEEIVKLVVEKEEISLNDIRKILRRGYSDTAISRSVEKLKKEKIIKSFMKDSKKWLRPQALENIGMSLDEYYDIYFRDYNNKNKKYCCNL